MSFEEFKETVYRRVGSLEMLDEKLFNDPNFINPKGCLPGLSKPLTTFALKYSNKKTREVYNIEELSIKADEILARPEIKELLCANLDATVSLPIEAAYKLTPVLYEEALKEEAKIPVDSVLFALICRKIAHQGVQNYCASDSEKV